MCGDGSLQNIHKCTLKACLLSKYFLKPSNHIVNTVTHCTYPCINNEDYPTICISAIIHLLTFSTCHLQDVGEIAQELN